MRIQALDQHANAVSDYLPIHHRAASMHMPKLMATSMPTPLAMTIPVPFNAQAMPINTTGPCDGLNDVPTFSSCRFSSWCAPAAAGGMAADAGGGASAGGLNEPDLTTSSAEYAPGDPILLAAISGSTGGSRRRSFSSSDLHLVDSRGASVGRSEPPPSESFTSGHIARKHAALMAEASPGAAAHAVRSNPFLYPGEKHLQLGRSFEDFSAAVRRVIADTASDQQPLERVPSSKNGCSKLSTLDPVSFFRSASQQENGVSDCAASHFIGAPLRTHSSIVSTSGPLSCLESSGINSSSKGGSGRSSSSNGAFHCLGGSSSSTSTRGATPPPPALAAAAVSRVADVMPSATRSPESAMLANPFTWKELEKSCRKLDEANVRISGIDLTHAPDCDDSDDDDLDNNAAGHKGQSGVCVENPGIWKQLSSFSLSSNEEASFKPHSRVHMDAGRLLRPYASPEADFGALQQQGGSTSSNSSFAAAAAEARRRGHLSGPVMSQCSPMAAITPGSSSAESSPSSSSYLTYSRLRLAWLGQRGQTHKPLFRRLLGAVGRSAPPSRVERDLLCTQ